MTSYLPMGTVDCNQCQTPTAMGMKILITGENNTNLTEWSHQGVGKYARSPEMHL